MEHGGPVLKIFLSHQKADSELTASIAAYLKVRHGLDCYLDLIDPNARGPVERLADHIRSEMDRCTQLLAVVSPSTSHSQWVPWEIGMATEKDFPLATFSGGNALPPEFLRKWPYLRTEADLDKYAAATKEARRTFTRKRSIGLNETASVHSSTADFYTTLRASLGQ
jgi:hypothetical protein